MNKVVEALCPWMFENGPRVARKERPQEFQNDDQSQCCARGQRSLGDKLGHRLFVETDLGEGSGNPGLQTVIGPCNRSEVVHDDVALRLEGSARGIWTRGSVT